MNKRYSWIIRSYNIWKINKSFLFQDSSVNKLMYKSHKFTQQNFIDFQLFLFTIISCSFLIRLHQHLVLMFQPKNELN